LGRSITLARGIANLESMWRWSQDCPISRRERNNRKKILAKCASGKGAKAYTGRGGTKGQGEGIPL